MGDRVRRLHYVIHGEPQNQTVEPAQAPAGGASAEAELWEQVEALIAVSHPWGSAPGAGDSGGSLSYGRLPDGAGLLCSARTVRGSSAHGGRAAERRVDALHLPAGGKGLGDLWPIDAWRSEVWDEDAELPRPAGHFDHGMLVSFAREQRGRVAPFLADVRRLFDARAGRQIVLVESEQETVARWIALACASLTGEYAGALTFVTRTARPYDAPQQILGIGPESEFDREDPVGLHHLYRVHDGLGGRGSPRAVDPWAEITAWRWIQGSPPRPPATGCPFVLGRSFSAGELPAPDSGMWRTVARSPDDLSGLVQTLTERAGSIELPEGDALRLLEQLVVLCQELAADASPAALRPLAGALARQRLALAFRGHIPLNRAALAGLPLDDESRRGLYAEFDARIEEAQRDRRGPESASDDALELRLFLAGEESRYVREVAYDLAGGLLQPDAERAERTVGLLERLASPVVDKWTLKGLAERSPGGKARGLAEAAAVPAVGGWLRKHLPEAPLTVRLAEAVARLRKEREHPEGVELFAALIHELEPQGRVRDAHTLNRVWDVVWHNSQPSTSETPRLLEICPPRLVVEAGRGGRLGHWLNRPQRFDPVLLDFARQVRGDPGLGPLARNMAELLAVTGELAADGAVLARAVDRLQALWPEVQPLDPQVEKGVLRVLAEALAGADLSEREAATAHRYLTTHSRRELLEPYRDTVWHDYDTDEKLRALSRDPKRLASLFYSWHRRQPGDTAEWRRVAETLLRDVLAAAVQRMDGRDLAAATARMHQRGGEEWKDKWADWSYRQRNWSAPQ